MKDPATDYARKVTGGKVVACRFVIQACRRHLSDLKESKKRSFPYRFDVEKASRPILFCQFVKHYKGKWRGQVFKPEPWQCFILGSLFGWVHKKTGLRRFRNAYAEVPRKNGKTFLAAAVALFMLLADKEGGAEVYAAATKKDQARLVWNDVWKIIKADPFLRGVLHQRYFRIEHDDTDSKFEALGSDSETLDGLNPHCTVKDELHAWPNRDLWDVISDAYGSRDQPLDFSITTAGNNPEGICYEVREHCLKILDPDQSDYRMESQFAYIATLDEGDEWDDPKAWAKANPNLGVSKSVEYLEQEVHTALLTPGKANAVKNKQLNVWTSAAEAWLDSKKWRACGGAVDVERLRGHRCFGGLDLASKTDMAASVLLFPPGPYDEWAVLCNFYLPQDNIGERSKKTRAPLELWAQAGSLTLTPGEIIDFGFIFQDCRRLADEFELISTGFDPWNAYQLATDLTEEGLEMVEMRQGFATLSAPCKELEALVVGEKLRHGGNPVLAWMASNVVIRMDANENYAPDKKKSRQKIDGIVALIMALGRAMQDGDEGGSIYDERGALVM